MNYLLDTNVISELRKQNAHASVVAWANAIHPQALFLSVVSVLEIERGILLVQRRDGHQAAVLRRWFERQILATFRGRIVGVDVAVARRAASLHIPDPAPERDSLIAATALVHGMALVTRNVQDFATTGASLVDPWA